MGVFLRCSEGTRHTHLFSLCWDRKEDTMEMFTVKMVMIDELGCDVIVDTFTISSELDSDYIEVWEEMKIAKARERYPEARGFYFEDSRDVQSAVDVDVDAELNGLRDSRDEDVEWNGNMPCDYSGICAGTSCPRFFGCQA